MYRQALSLPVSPLIVWAALLLAACTPAAAPSTPAPNPDSGETDMPAETPVPTGTPAAAPSDADEPLPTVSMDSLVGAWTQPEAEGSETINWLLISEDGTWDFRNGSVGENYIAKGTFTLSGDEISLSFLSLPPGSPECAESETYTITFLTVNKIRLDLAGGCGIGLFVDQPVWNRYISDS